ncbi:rhodanese-like domain-containing protein [Aliiglaciecola sp. 3_MG-2023]|uniref:rhodanese-like domain-containing protein n=1 Tax=Aliiglaciecola sp. 3_MG-2023 TaxID=3062644 RepID=UPI0026E27DE6|nr:rhodanese-like domain-containing protein [Aliiglaciecola sp. 3_MG-2023]MDO6693784.1 rhodanese-like domain-containing protein [Aliiglaciecola sp. 3_MG-2023]
MLKTIPDLLQEARQNVRTITAKEANAEREQNNGIIIDVREPAEFEAGSASGAVNVPRGLLEVKMLEMEKDPNRPIYLHCASSLRAALGAEQLARVGYQNVSVITCSMDDIKKACC